jgi:isocitrate dehydrogenase kinase/phosphatase
MTENTSTDSLAELVAATILQGFDAQYGRFLEVTSGAQARFENAQWQDIQSAMKKRINLYDHHVGLSSTLISRMIDTQHYHPDFLRQVKKCFTRLLPEYPRYEIAESFFNSVYCHLFQYRHLSPDTMFVQSSQPSHPRIPSRPLAHEYELTEHNLEDVLEEILTETTLRLGWEDIKRDVSDIARYLRERFNGLLSTGKFQIYNELFFRNKAAWMVGKLRLPDGLHPFLLPIHRSQDGKLYVDTCLTKPQEATIAFGFNRAYFMVHAPLPSALVEWLREMLPDKSTADLYTAIGCQKHGKTEYHREFLAHVEKTDEPFIVAPGIRGMVMLVFTMPTYNRVFKIIRDKFAPQKNVDVERVRETYRIVKEHDRVGRMADTQEYENFVIEKNRVSEELLKELRQECSERIEEEHDTICIKHLYIERRMIPLNIYMEHATAEQKAVAVEEYGDAIKNLAAANIFPGDMLIKNFGITQNERVVFYDYDEIRYMTEINFRDIPQPRCYEDEMASEPWYSVGENDVFPEEFQSFLYGAPDTRELFQKLHGDLYKPEYWRQLQQRIRDGEIVDVYAYRKQQRFRQRDD